MRILQDTLKGLSMDESINLIYKVALGREPTESDLGNSLRYLVTGNSLEAYIKDVFHSEEHINRCLDAYLGIVHESNTPVTKSLLASLLSYPDDEFVYLCYKIFLGRKADPGGFQFYMDRLSNGYRRTRIIYDILRSPDARPSRQLSEIISFVSKFERRLSGFIGKNIAGYLFVDKLITLLSKSDHIPDGLLDNRNNTIPDVSSYAQDQRKQQELTTSDAAISIDSIRRLDQQKYQHNDANQNNCILVISMGPFEKTGVAHFNTRLFSSGICEVDYFCHFSKPIDYWASQLYEREGCFNIYDLSTVFYALKQKSYECVIVVLANSDHNTQAAIYLDRLLSFSFDIYLYIHDVVLLNLASKFLQYSGHDYISEFKKSIPSVQAEKYEGSIRSGDYRVLVANGVLGLEFILRDRMVKGIFVNSNHAKDLIQQFHPKYRNVITVLYIPVFDEFEVRNRTSREDLVIGTFGVPGDDKLTLHVIEAFSRLKRNIPNSKLVLAGYGAKMFVDNLYNLPDEVKISILSFEPETADELRLLMREVDIAVQLRKSSNGESSGVVPQLLSVDCPCLVSRVGSFEDFSGVVSFVEQDASVDNISQALSKMAVNDQIGSNARMEYVISHSAIACMQIILKTVRSAYAVNKPESRFERLMN
ncbi:DUF4214 domain-containing protein [Acidithiobacillus ferrooxidans]|uniref:DUF4214 domain-containing protein n=1 Tax=Acidithiobacillus ferrooxidans TaxID=920 RepID=UPI002147B2BC|nr:DUF4214 domain-containing protein [Acidithiobacillus ferrooxidans]MCR1354006.1 DUF4214 domain-containing protein [Acidithiobacillus ferrooxidans]